MVAENEYNGIDGYLLDHLAKFHAVYIGEGHIQQYKVHPVGLDIAEQVPPVMEATHDFQVVLVFKQGFKPFNNDRVIVDYYSKQFIHRLRKKIKLKLFIRKSFLILYRQKKCSQKAPPSSKA